MKFELVWEYISHYCICVLVFGLCGMLLPATGIIVFAGHGLVNIAEVPRFGMSITEATVIYGSVSFVAINLVTKAWMIEFFVTEWMNLHSIHHDAVKRLKFDQAYFKRVATH